MKWNIMLKWNSFFNVLCLYFIIVILEFFLFFQILIFKFYWYFPLVQFSPLSHVWLFATRWTTAHQASLSITNSGSSLKPCPLSQWSAISHLSQVSHPTISPSVIPFCSWPQSFPASGSFQMSQVFASGGQSIGVSTSTSVFPMNTQDGFPLGWTGWISLQPVLVFHSLGPRDFQESSPIPQFKSINSLALSFLHSPTLTSIHDYWKNHGLD